MKDSMLQYMDMIIFSVGIMMIFGAILGFAIVYNVTIISISERSMEFSSLRVMGFDKREIYKLISRENGIMTLIGVILGGSSRVWNVRRFGIISFCGFI